MNPYLKIKNWKLKIRLARKGFSIAEVIISLFVITVGLVAVLGLIASSVRDSAASRQRIIATHLALEGIELVRNIRDNNLAAGEDFNYGLGTVSGTCADIATDTVNPSLVACSDYKLKYNIDSTSQFYQFYHHSAPMTVQNDTAFSRRVNITDGGLLDNGGTGHIWVASCVWWQSATVSCTPSTCNLANKCVMERDLLTEHP